MRTNIPIALTCLAVLCSGSPPLCFAQDKEHQSPALRHTTKARDFANRNDDKRDKDSDRATSNNGKGIEAGDVPEAVSKVLEESNKTFKSLDKSLDMLEK